MISFNVNIELRRVDGPTATRAQLVAELLSAIQSIDADVYIDDSFYQVTSIKVRPAKRGPR